MLRTSRKSRNQQLPSERGLLGITDQQVGLSLEESFLKFRELISADMNWADSRKVRSRRWAATVKIAVVTLGAGSTVILGLNSWTDGPRAALFMTAGVTVLGALELYFGWRPRWVLNAQTQYQLNRVRDEMDYYMVTTPSAQWKKSKLDEFHRQQQAIWSHVNDRWMNVPDERAGASATAARDGDVQTDGGPSA